MTEGLDGLPEAFTTTGAATAQEPLPVYVVMGTTGEYGDRSEWLVRAYHTEEAAKGCIDRLTEERQRLPPRSYECGEQAFVEEAMRAFDPGFQEDYTGTSWFYQRTELVSDGAPTRQDEAVQSSGMNNAPPQAKP